MTLFKHQRRNIEFQSIESSWLENESIAVRKDSTIGEVKLQDNKSQSIELDSIEFTGGIHLKGNPLLPDAISYLESLTNMNVTN